MARQKGTLSLASNIEPSMNAPLDARTVVNTLADLTASGSFPYFYEGMIVAVKGNHKIYQLIGADPTVSANWEEVGTGAGGSIQVTVLPTASATEVNNIYQYIGATDATYTNGYFYKCVNNSGTYSWVQINVQPSSGGGGGGTIYTGILLATGWNSTTKQQTVTFTGYNDSYGGVIGLPEDATSAQKEEYRNCIISTVSQTGATVTFECEEIPTINLPVEIYCGGGAGGDASLESDVITNIEVGGIASGTTLAQGTTFTEFVQKLLVKEMAPTTIFTASGSGVKEVGTSVTPTLTLNITGTGTGTPTSIKFYSGSTLLNTQSYVSGTNSYTFTMASAVTTDTTVKGVLEYTKSDGTTTASVEKTASYTFVMASYYGAVTTAPTTKAGIIALTKNVKNTKAQTATFNLSNQRSCYCYPASFGNLTSIKDANNFEYLSSYTKTNVTVDGVSYNVYTLTDPVTASSFKQIYA